MTKLYLIMAAALFIGCDEQTPLKIKETGYEVANFHIHEACVNGVKYYFHDRSMTAAYGTDQKVILCK